MKILTSKKYRINLFDLLKGFVVAALTAVLTGCGQMVESWIMSGSFSVDKVSLIIMSKTAIVGGGAYLVKQFFSSPKLTISSVKEENE